MQPKPLQQQSNFQPNSTFLQSTTSKEAATEAVDAVDKDVGSRRQGVQGGRRNTHTPFANYVARQGGSSLPTIAMQQVPGLPFTGTGPANASHSNIIKWYANMNACFSCGFNVEDGHTSKTCPAIWRCMNHQEGYDRSNAQQYIAPGYNACTKAMHKTQYLNFRWCGAEQVNNIVNLKDAINVYETLDPIKTVNIVDNDKTVVSPTRCSKQRALRAAWTMTMPKQ